MPQLGRRGDLPPPGFTVSPQGGYTQLSLLEQPSYLVSTLQVPRDQGLFKQPTQLRNAIEASTQWHDLCAAWHSIAHQ